MRICFISDIHANLIALNTVLDKAKSLNVDQYICLGDCVGYGPNPKECIEILASMENIQFVRGNHDHAVGTKTLEFGCNRIAAMSTKWTITQLSDHHFSWLRNLPLEKDFGNWSIVHGAPRDPKKMYGYVYEMTYEDNLDVAFKKKHNIVFYGHTHIPFIHQRTTDGKYLKIEPINIKLNTQDTYLINPGSIGQPRDGNSNASFGIWDKNEAFFEFHRIAYNIDQIREAILKSNLPNDLADRLEIGR